MKRPARRTTAFALVILLGSSLPALAAATPEGASELATSLQAYFGGEPGVVSVTPDGEAYAARIDFGPYFAKIREQGVSVSLTPIELRLTDQGGGMWQVDQDQSLSFAFKAEGTVDMKASFGSIKGTGLFDESLGAFRSSATDLTQFAFQQSMTEGGATSEVTYTIAAMRYESAMEGNGDSADGTFKLGFTDLRETISTPAAPDGSVPPMQFAINAPSGAQDGTIRGFRPRAISELVAWLVARPSPAAIVAGQADLKDKLRAALPLWKSLSTTSTVNNVTVNTMMGLFGMDRFDNTVELAGIVPDGSLRTSYGIAGLKLPDGIVPPFAAGLVPRDFTIDVNVTDFDLAAPAALLIDNLDLAKDPPLDPGLEQQLLQALLPKMIVTIGLNPSEIIASAFHLKAEGSMTAGPIAVPAGNALIRLKGIDDIMAALQAAPPDMGLGQMAPVFIVAKGMGKQESDGFLSWKIESTPQGSVTINGTDISQIGGGQ